MKCGVNAATSEWLVRVSFGPCEHKRGRGGGKRSRRGTPPARHRRAVTAQQASPAQLPAAYPPLVRCSFVFFPSLSGGGGWAGHGRPRHRSGGAAEQRGTDAPRLFKQRKWRGRQAVSMDAIRRVSPAISASGAWTPRVPFQFPDRFGSGNVRRAFEVETKPKPLTRREC